MQSSRSRSATTRARVSRIRPRAQRAASTHSAAGDAVRVASIAGDFHDRGPCRGFVDQGLAVGEGGDQGMHRQVVHGPGQSPAGLVDEGDGVVAEQRVGAAGQPEVVLDVAGGLGLIQSGDLVAQRQALIEGGKTAEADPTPEAGLSEDDAGEGECESMAELPRRRRASSCSGDIDCASSATTTTVLPRSSSSVARSSAAWGTRLERWKHGVPPSERTISA